MKVKPRYTRCDVCYKKIRITEAEICKDKYHRFYGLILCREDRKELANPQSRLRVPKELGITSPELYRPEQVDTFAQINTVEGIETGQEAAYSYTAASKPLRIQCFDATTSTISLIWEHPKTLGNSQITGYQIERESPVGGGFSTLTANTESSANQYTDSTVASGTQYNYRISAINKAGAGAASDEFAVTTPSS